jgi:recombination protein RecA
MAGKADKISEFFKSYAESEEQLNFRFAGEQLLNVPVTSTGSISLDDALGCGGLPNGRIIQYYGPPGSGKSAMSMLAIKNAQEKDPSANQVFIDAENTFSPIWAEKLGLNLDKIILIDEDLAVNGRRCFEMLLGVPKEDMKHVLKGKSKEGLLDQIINKEININLIVLDSLGALIPPGEDVSAVGKSNMALMARFLSTSMKKLSLEVTKAKVPFIVINHKRDNMDMYGGDHTFSGGNSFAHFLSANIYFEPYGGKTGLILNENEERIGQNIRATVEKSKFGPHPKKCEFKLKFDEGIIAQEEEIADLAIAKGIITKLSSVSYEYNDTKWTGIGKCYEGVKTIPGLMDELRGKILSFNTNKKELTTSSEDIKSVSDDVEKILKKAKAK